MIVSQHWRSHGTPSLIIVARWAIFFFTKVTMCSFHCVIIQKKIGPVNGPMQIILPLITFLEYKHRWVFRLTAS